MVIGKEKPMNLRNLRKGNLVLFLILVIGAGGAFLGYQIFPSLSMLNKRMAEDSLTFALSEMRISITLERSTKASAALFNTDWDTKANFLAYLKDLVNRKYLSKITPDPMIRPEIWGEGTNQWYWVPTKNFVASSGFEVDDLVETRWIIGSNKIKAHITPNNVWEGEALGGNGHAAVVVKD